MRIDALYQTVTDRIISELEAGKLSWVRPWRNGRNTGVMPHNGATHRAYTRPRS